MVEYHPCYYCGNLIAKTEECQLPFEVYPPRYAHYSCAGVTKEEAAGPGIGSRVSYNSMNGTIKTIDTITQSAFIEFDNGLKGTLQFYEFALI